MRPSLRPVLHLSTHTSVGFRHTCSGGGARSRGIVHVPHGLVPSTGRKCQSPTLAKSAGLCSCSEPLWVVCAGSGHRGMPGTGGRPGGVRVQQGVPHSGHPALGSTRSVCSSQPCPGTSFHVACLTQKPSPVLPQTAEAPGPAGPQRPCPTSPVTQQYGPRGLPAAALAASVGLPPCLSLTFTNEQGAEGGRGRTSHGDGRGGLAPEAQEENQVLTMQFLF